MKKRTYDTFKDLVYNNPRAENQDVNMWDDKQERQLKKRTLYDDMNVLRRIEALDRLINAYKAKRLLLKNQMPRKVVQVPSGM